MAWFTASWSLHEGQVGPGPQTRPVQKKRFLGRISRGLRGQLPGPQVGERVTDPWGGGRPALGAGPGPEAGCSTLSLPPASLRAESALRCNPTPRSRSWGAGAQRPSPRGPSATSLRRRPPASRRPPCCPRRR